MKHIKLPPYNAITGRSLTKQGHYASYRIWRKSEGYKLWLKKQWAIQSGKCYYCSISLINRKHNVEHIIAQRRWGETEIKNMVLSCPDCNKAKGSSKASRELRNEVSYFNHINRYPKKKK